jgi:hypothetical protein
MLCYYDDTIVPDVNNSITYNSSNNLLLNGNLGISYAEMKKKLYVMDLGRIPVLSCTDCICWQF